MALSKDKKAEVVDEVAGLLKDSKLTVVAKYQGTSVKSMQELRRASRDNGTKIVVVKNRLFKKAIENDQRFKDTDLSAITGQLMYAFNSEDEVAPAQSLANFAKTQPQIEFVGAFDAEGNLLPAEDVAALASLPSKDQLRGMLVGTLAAPLTGFAGVMSASVRSILNVFSARAESLGE